MCFLSKQKKKKKRWTRWSMQVHKYKIMFVFNLSNSLTQFGLKLSLFAKEMSIYIYIYIYIFVNLSQNVQKQLMGSFFFFLFK